VGRSGVGHGLPVRRGHLTARAGLGLHAGRGERGSHGLGIHHLAGDVGDHTATLRQGEADVVVATLHGVGGQGETLTPRSLAHVHPAARAVGGVRVAAGLHHLALATEGLVALDGAEHGGEGRREEVLDLHGECAFCGCCRCWVCGDYKGWRAGGQEGSSTFFIWDSPGIVLDTGESRPKLQE
jgi:hypothetical protein